MVNSSRRITRETVKGQSIPVFRYRQRHGMHTRDIESMVTIFEERISIEFDHLVGNASNADPITDCLCHKQHNLICKETSASASVAKRTHVHARTMVGRMYVKAPCGGKGERRGKGKINFGRVCPECRLIRTVSSNIMTTTDTVILITPPRAAAAPRKAYVPGVMHGKSGLHTANHPLWGYCLWGHSVAFIYQDAHNQPVNCLNNDSDQSTECRTDRHRRNEYSSGNLASV